jgi:hypothetical protein
MKRASCSRKCAAWWFWGIGLAYSVGSVPSVGSVGLVGSVRSIKHASPAGVSGPLTAATPLATKVGDHQYRIGKVSIDTRARQVHIPCRVNMRRGAIEFLAVASEGKLHESVLLAEAEPLHVHVALMLLGLEPGSGARYHGDLSPPSGPGVEARVRWQAGGQTRSARLEQFAWDIPARQPMPPVAWLFTGAAPPGRGPRTAEERSVVATYRDPGAVLTNPLPTGADDTVYKVNERLVPAVGAAVELLLLPAAGGVR